MSAPLISYVEEMRAFSKIEETSGDYIMAHVALLNFSALSRQSC